MLSELEAPLLLLLNARVWDATFVNYLHQVVNHHGFDRSEFHSEDSFGFFGRYNVVVVQDSEQACDVGDEETSYVDGEVRRRFGRHGVALGREGLVDVVQELRDEASPLVQDKPVIGSFWHCDCTEMSFSDISHIDPAEFAVDRWNLRHEKVAQHVKRGVASAAGQSANEQARAQSHEFESR